MTYISPVVTQLDPSAITIASAIVTSDINISGGTATYFPAYIRITKA